MCTLFRAITNIVPSLFRGLFSERDFGSNRMLVPHTDVRVYERHISTRRVQYLRMPHTYVYSTGTAEMTARRLFQNIPLLAKRNKIKSANLTADTYMYSRASICPGYCHSWNSPLSSLFNLLKACVTYMDNYQASASHFFTIVESDSTLEVLKYCKLSVCCKKDICW